MFNWLKRLILEASNRRKQHDAWAKNYTGSTAGKNNQPLDPDNDPWRT